MDPEADEAQQWLAFIYNLRGYEMTPLVWEKFKAWCETRGINLLDPRFETLPGGKV